MDAVYRLAFEMSRNAIPAVAVARVVHHALTARRPKTRYLVGRDAKLQAQLVPCIDRLADLLSRDLSHWSRDTTRERSEG